MKIRKLTLLILIGLFWNWPVQAEEGLQEVIVPAGETLWSISNKYLKDPKKWPEIVKYNPLSVSDPTIPIAGSRIKIPVALIKEEFQNAQLIKSIPDVQYKRKNENNWRGADLNMQLHYEDSLRTMAGGQAQVRFPSKEIVQINENSYVILRPEKIMQEIQLLKGDIRASRAKVVTPKGATIKPSGAKSDFQAKIREDETEVVFVYKGKVDVTAQGKTVTVLEGYGTQIPKSAPPMEPVPLPTFPDFNPAEMTINAPPSASLELPKPPVVTKKPDDDKSAAPARSRSLVSNNVLVSYKMQLSLSPDFKNIVLEKTEPMGTPFEIRKQSISDGTYYMRVAFLDALGSLGSFSQPSQVIKDSMAPEVKNVMPNNGQNFKGDENYCDVSGVVDGATVLSINNEIVFINLNGSFTKLITLHPGENVIRIAARDPQGNETIVNRKVTYTPK